MCDATSCRARIISLRAFGGFGAYCDLPQITAAFAATIGLLTQGFVKVLPCPVCPHPSIARLGSCYSSPGRPIVREEAKDGFVCVCAVHPGGAPQRSLPREPDPGCRREHRGVVREGLDLQAL